MTRLTQIIGLAVLIVSIWILSAANATDTISDKVKVISNDTLVINGQCIRIFGINTPELDQSRHWSRKTIGCRKISHKGRLGLIAQATAKRRRKSRASDGDWIVTCQAKAFDLERNKVHTGWPMVTPDDLARYSTTQKKSKKTKRGIRRSTFVLPWLWRQQHK